MKEPGIRLGISGGTFDPIHYGHLIVAEEIRETNGLDRILFIPSGKPPHKRNLEVSGAEQRFSMVEAAIRKNPYFEVSRIEIDREGYTYTVDTLEQLKEIYGRETKLYFIIGADVVHDLLTWKNYEKVFSLCEFIAVQRPGYTSSSFIKTVEDLETAYSAQIHTFIGPLIDISSTMIRERAASGKSIKYLLPEEVEKYILDNGLYRTI
jgi:nicotinate-nucleotide adenylyltransferase